MSNTIRALENANRLVRNIPLDRAAQGLMAARTGYETAEGDFQNKIRGLQMPGLELSANRDKRQLARETQPFNLKKYFDMGGITGDQGAMLVQDQKNGMPVGFEHFANNVKNVHGITFDENWNAVTKDGKPLAEAEAGPVLQELQGTLGLYTNPIRAKEYKLADLQDKFTAAKDPKEKQAIQSQMEKLNAIPESKLLGQYIQDLQTTIANHKQYGRDPSDAMLRLDWAINEYNAAVGSESERSKREYETQKEKDRRAFELKKLGIQEAGKDRRVKKGGKAPSTSDLKFQNEQALEHLIGQAAAAGIPLEYNEVGGIATQLDPQQMEALNGMAGSLGLQVYAQPIEVETGGDDWIPFNQKKVPMFQVHSIVPASGGGNVGGQAQKIKGADTPAMDMPEPKQAPDGNFYVPDPNRPGKYLKVKQPQKGGEAVSHDSGGAPDMMAKSHESQTVQPMADIDGMQVGRGNKGYMVLGKNGQWKPADKKQMEKIQRYLMRNGVQGGRPVEFNTSTPTSLQQAGKAGWSR